MEVYQALILMISFGSFVATLIFGILGEVRKGRKK